MAPSFSTHSKLPGADSRPVPCTHASLRFALAPAFLALTPPSLPISPHPSAHLQLDNVRDRVDEIESLHRTSELTVKADNDLGGFLRLRVGNLGREHEKKAEEEDEEKYEPKREV